MTDKPDNVDPLPALIAELDQALAMAGQAARMIRGYYDAFLEQGFTETQAPYAALAWTKGLGDPPG